MRNKKVLKIDKIAIKWEIKIRNFVKKNKKNKIKFKRNVFLKNLF